MNLRVKKINKYERYQKKHFIQKFIQIQKTFKSKFRKKIEYFLKYSLRKPIIKILNQKFKNYSFCQNSIFIKIILYHFG